MKRLIILASALFLMVGLASAQTADTTFHHGFGGRKMAMQRHGKFGMMQKLNLTDDQKQQMKAANDDYHKQLTALQGNDKISLGEYKLQLSTLQKITASR